MHLVEGKCPSCHNTTLFLGEGGYVTCSFVDCKEPDAAHKLLEQGDALKAALPSHFPVEIRCDHEAKTDTIYCDCGFRTEPEPSIWKAKQAWAEHVAEVALLADTEERIIPEGDERCDEPKDACRCMLRKNHEGSHRCVHGSWLADTEAPRLSDCSCRDLGVVCPTHGVVGEQQQQGKL